MNITVRNIPEEVIEKIRTLSRIARRSLNNEILIILERGVQKEIDNISMKKNFITTETQINIWTKLAELWEDDRTSAEIIEDIYTKRSPGRDIHL